MKRGGVRNQEVTDAQGRRRFHGAFTGGYSAGYYNSVGSEEGWTPRTFSSSRGDRMPRVEQRAEDFMDEEDDPLLGKRLETTERYDTLQTGAKRRLQQQQQTDQGGAGAGAIPGFALPDDWVLPVDDSIGAKLLKQMGWKEGHGIGQRVRRRKFLEEKEGEETPKLLTQGVQEETTEMGARVDAEEEVYVPPRKVFDVQKAFPKPKLDRYGAGFDPYTNAPEFSRYKQQEEEKQRAKEGSHRQVVSFSDALKATNGSNRATTAYGLSALEEDDDIDVYGSVSMAEFDRVIAPLGAKKDLKRLDSSAQESRRREKTAACRTLCSDGRPVLPGFELSASKEKPPKAVNLRLAVPAEFKAYHRFDEDVGRADSVTVLYRKHNFSIDAASNGGMVVTAKQRSVLLGEHEQANQGHVGQNDTDNGATASGSGEASTGSVFDLLGEEQRAKLFSVAAQAKQGLPLSSTTRTAPVEESPAPRTRQPLVACSGGDQFRATISASIAKRFVSSTSTVADDKSELVATQEPQSKMSRRSQSLWIPKSLLCKRFHVKCAGLTRSSGKSEDDDKRRNLFDEELVPHLMEFAADRAVRRQPTEQVDTARQPGKEANAEGESAQDSELAPLPAVKIASASLLKSIFEPSDESDESDNDSEDESDDEVNGEDQKEEIVQANRGPLSLPEKLSQRKDFESDRHAASSAESSSSDDDISSSFAVAPGSGDGEKSKQGVKRSKSVDGDDEQHTKEKKRTHKKHKKHHRSKHRSSREDKDKKKDKKNRKERHKHRSSRHSRRSQSRSQSRERSAADRHRSSSNRRR
ncbi:hypothetical protein PF005_g23627 [Phytophthora fragariae]|uniref:G-patch domain-containing protein n=1 Tax=Phytophthora fragariae TaxID=53985 RepID=A0A6A4C358_9STRA|nr:hypothetical protein PF003_g9591 [Phytophthora fragariae]KAE8925121.1 hypothetical protein PF009_g24663 [Phytophthora fragariae]KAE9078329.1 hypothetical protein PF007_g23908 [Phytophthora fragariae]KAE9099243.1 hypothetical protein PF006_g23182 [Phytophthora fragariae]KAE9179593.1 hypothetical protein PF005_g23627 [Phytophthora fragariae]